MFDHHSTLKYTIEQHVCVCFCVRPDQAFYFNSGAFNYLDVGVDLTNRQYVVLQAKACSGVYISLTSQSKLFSGTGFYETVFDSYYNGVYNDDFS